MYSGGDALFGHYWWLWLSVLTFLLGWWLGRHVVAHVLRETLNSQLDALRHGRATAESKLEAVEKATAEQVAKINALQSELSASSQAKNEHDAALKAREKELAQVKSLSQVVLGQMDAIEAEKAAVHTSYKARERVFEEIKTQHEHLRNQYAALESEKTALHASLQMRETELAELKAASERESNSKPPRLDSPEAGTMANHTAVLELPQTVPTGAVSAPPSGRILRDRQDETAHCANCPQHLSDVKGIGSGFETKLYSAGIGTYWDLSRLSNDEMTRILAVNEGLRKRFNFDAVRADALGLADESHTKGRSWTRSKPDDFEPLKGLGHTFEKRLYDAGICTFAALAASTPGELHDICRPPAHFKKPDYAAWIEQARTLAHK